MIVRETVLKSLFSHACICSLTEFVWAAQFKIHQLSVPYFLTACMIHFVNGNFFYVRVVNFQAQPGIPLYRCIRIAGPHVENTCLKKSFHSDSGLDFSVFLFHALHRVVVLGNTPNFIRVPVFTGFNRLYRIEIIELRRKHKF